MSAIRPAIRIASYFWVGFVLIFLGKISKAELFQTYTRAIAEVSNRNSQDVNHQLLQASVVEAGSWTKSIAATPTPATGLHNTFAQDAAGSRKTEESFSIPASQTASPAAVFLHTQPAMAP